MTIVTIDRKPVRVAARRYVGPFGEPLGKFWRNVVTPWLADNGLVDCPRFGVPLDNPLSTPPDQCRYDCCVELPLGLGVADASETTVPGGKYAVTPFKGTGAQIGAAWEGFVRGCMASGMKMDVARPAFEHYPRGATLDSKTGVFVCELCLPIEERTG
ncbi:MAG: GyrI-like domain-containing protein [Steroidobacteraceae bacterium]|nr:GyrI-like domain-containing protein [Steroidobacteraceae bacterium]